MTSSVQATYREVPRGGGSQGCLASILQGLVGLEYPFHEKRQTRNHRRHKRKAETTDPKNTNARHRRRDVRHRVIDDGTSTDLTEDATLHTCWGDSPLTFDRSEHTDFSI